jgi:hypothetical protein
MSSSEPKPGAVPLQDDELRGVLQEYMSVTAKLQQTHEALRGEIIRLRGELASKDRELELRRRLAALGELAAGVAHEVRNPLGAIELYSDLLGNQCRQHALGPGLELVDKIKAGIQAIDAVVQDTLALAPRDRQLDVCDLRAIVARAGDAAQKTLTERAVELVINAPTTPLSVRGDADGLQRVLVNLIVNAAEVSQPGQQVRMALGCSAADEAELAVADDGPGLPDDGARPHFRPLLHHEGAGHRIGTDHRSPPDRSVRGSPGGGQPRRGRGGVCHSLAARHGRRRGGRAATHCAGHERSLKNRRRTHGLHLRNRRPGDDARVARSDAGRHDHKVFAYDNAQEALTIIKQQSFDAILTDLRMPGMDGVGAAARDAPPGASTCPSS